MARNYSNTLADTTLAAALTSDATLLTVASLTGAPTAPYALVLTPGDPATEEIVLVTAAAGATLTVTRGYDGTTAKAHASGATVRHAVIAADLIGRLAAGDNVTLTGAGTAASPRTIAVPSVPWADLTGTPTTLSGYGITDAASAAALTAHEAEFDAHTGLTTTAHGGIVASTDPRLTNARTPTDHAASHATAGSDPLTPGAIGAVDATAARAAGAVLAGPTSGADAAPTFRPLVERDIPAAPLPRHHNLLAWAFDPAALVGTIAPTAGVLTLIKIWLPELRTYTLTTIWIEVGVVGSGLTTAALGVYSSAGSLLGQTASQASAWTTATLKSVPLTASVNVAGGPGAWVYVGVLSAGGTAPQFRRGTIGQASNAGILASEGVRFGTIGSALAALPSSIVVADVTAPATNVPTFWVALS